MFVRLVPDPMVFDIYMYKIAFERDSTTSSSPQKDRVTESRSFCERILEPQKQVKGMGSERRRMECKFTFK